MPPRFLIVRLDGLGDTMLTTPLLHAIRTHWPDGHVTAIASPAGHACLVDHPGLDELIVFSPTASTFREKLALGRRLREARPDIAISVTEKAWGYLWLRMTGARRRIGFWAGSEKPIKSLLFRPTLTDPVPVAEHLHEAERHMALLEPLGVSAEAGPLWLGPNPGTEDARNDRRVALHLSAKWLTDGWSESWLEQMVHALADDTPLLLTAGALEGAWARAFCERVAHRAGRIETLLDVTFPTWTAALRRCRRLVSMDTGAVHVAAGLGLPVVDVFPRADAERCVPRWRPWKVPHRIVLRPPGPPDEDGDDILQEIVEASRSLENGVAP